MPRTLSNIRPSTADFRSSSPAWLLAAATGAALAIAGRFVWDQSRKAFSVGLKQDPEPVRKKAPNDLDVASAP